MKILSTLFALLYAAAPAMATIFNATAAYRPPAHNPDSIAVADFNGDGRDDVMATEQFCAFRPCSLMLFHQTTGGLLADPVIFEGVSDASGIQAAHFSDDPRMDFAVPARDGLHVFLQRDRKSVV